jgi:glycosyltransferase involved in cell wall biosynthesis
MQPRDWCVTMIGSWPPDPGISAYCVQLVGALRQLVPVEVLTFRHLYPRFLYPGGAAQDDSFPRLPDEHRFVRRELAWYNPLGWVRAATRAHGRIMHVQFWSLPLVPVLLTLMAIARLRGVKCVVTVHNLEGHERRRLFRVGLSAVLALANAVIVHVDEVPSWIRRLRGLRHRVFPVAHGVLDLYRGEQVSRPQARAALDLPQQPPVVLFFGAIRPYKGLDVLLEAFAQVVPRVPDTLLVIAGHPWEPWSRYESLIAGLQLSRNVRLYTRYIPTGEVHYFFEAADVAVFPYHEFAAQSGAALTALAFGKPVIVADVGGLARLQPDPRFVMRPGDAAGLADMLVRVLTDADTARSLAQGSARVAAGLAWDGVARETVRVYHAVSSAAPTTSG